MGEAGHRKVILLLTYSTNRTKNCYGHMLVGRELLYFKIKAELRVYSKRWKEGAREETREEERATGLLLLLI